MARTGRLWQPSSRAELATVLAGAAVASFSGGVLAPVLPVYVAGAGVDASALGLLFSGMAVALAIAEVGWGWMVDRPGPLVPILAGTLAMGAATALFLVARSLAFFALVFLLYGAFRSPLFVVARWYMGTYASPATRTRAMAALVAVMWAMQSVAGFASGAIADTWGPAATVAVASGVSALAGVAFLITVRRLSFRSPSYPTRDPSASQPPQPTTRAAYRTIAGLGTLSIAFFACISTVSAFLPLLATQIMGESAGRVGLLFGLRGLVQFVAVLPVARLADRLGKRTFVAVGLLVVALAMAGVGLSQEFLWLGCAMSVLALGSALYSPSAAALLSEGVPVQRQGTAMGVYGFLEDVGLIAGPAIGGLLWARSSPQSPFFFGSAVATLAALIFLLLRCRPRFARTSTATDS